MAQDSLQSAPQVEPAAVAEFADELSAAALDPQYSQALGRSVPAGSAAPTNERTSNLDLIMNIPITLKVIVGSATMPVAALAKLGRGSLVPLDRRVGEKVDIVVNGRTVARGEVVVIEEDGGRFGVSIDEVIARVST